MEGHKSLRAYCLAYDLAMEVFRISRSFPNEEKYSLTDQIRRSSRSIAANIAEGYRKRQYTKMFASKLADADGEVAETQVWLDIARDCDYIPKSTHESMTQQYQMLGAMLGKMMREPEKFLPRGL
ncbi:MAG: four helix bundle protein [Pyrinomonadaceae bacterium]|nr:four helix bundle protein [Pyrinomonadaceae bacterium]